MTQNQTKEVTKWGRVSFILLCSKRSVVLTGAGQLLDETSSLCRTTKLILGYHGVSKNIRETWWQRAFPE